MNNKSSYNDWLIHIKKLVSRLRGEILDKSKVKCSIIEIERRPPIVRLITGGEFLDFRVKEIRTSDTKNVWIGKVVDVKTNTNFIIHTRKENDWLCVTGRVIVHRAEEKASNYYGKHLMYVLDISYLRPFRQYLKTLEKQEQRRKQKRLDGYV